MNEDKNGKGKSILGAPPKVVKKESKQNNHRSTNKKCQLKKPHFCHYYGASGHTRPNCYKWLATQQSNSVSSFGSQNQLQLSLASLRELLKAIMLLLNFNPPPYSSKQSFMQKKVSPSKPSVWKEKDTKNMIFCFENFLRLSCSLPQNDFLFWPMDRYGEYIVKSNYKIKKI